MPDVVFDREIHPGDRGLDVIEHKRVLSRWDSRVYPWAENGQFTDFAGKYFWTGMYEYKRRHGLLSAKEKQLGTAIVLGIITHNSMEKAIVQYGPHKGEPAYDARSIQLANEYHAAHTMTREQLARSKGVAALLYWYNHRYQIPYRQIRPFQVGSPPMVPTRGWDCSADATNGHLAAGFPNPNGSQPVGEGYTGTLIDHGTRINSLADIDLLDLIFYGFSSGTMGFRRGDPTHVATYIGVINGIHTVHSNGHFPMALYAWNYRTVNQMRHYHLSAAAAEAFLASLPKEGDL